MKKIVSFLAVALLIVLLSTCSSPHLLRDSTNSTTDSILTDDGDYYILGGDILLDKRDPIHQVIIETLLGDAPAARAVKKESVQAWADGIVNYWLEGEFTQTDRDNLRTAMDAWESVCNVTFVEQAEGGLGIYRIYKVVDPNIGGASTLGYSWYPYYKFVSNYTGTIIHELGHCLGFSHEHQRFDRDDYITINWDNIMDGYSGNFTYIPEYANDMLNSRVWAEYDYESIMHYPAWGFSNNGLPTIDAQGHDIGQRTHLSAGDIAGAVGVYGGGGGYNKTFDQVYLRGTFNSWNVTGMQLVDDYTWQTEVTFGSTSSERFKFDIGGDWSHNYGDSNNDGYCEQWGADIYTSSGTRIITFNDQTKAYTVTDTADETTINVIYDCGYANSIYIRGGMAPLSWNQGQPMSWTSGNIWTWTTTEPEGWFECKALINDSQWQSGSNTWGEAGTTVNIYPNF